MSHVCFKVGMENFCDFCVISGVICGDHPQKELYSILYSLAANLNTFIKSVRVYAIKSNLLACYK